MPFGLLCSFFFCPPPPLSKYLRSCSLVVNQPSIRQQPFALHDAFSFFRVPHATRPLLCIHHHPSSPINRICSRKLRVVAVPVSTEQCISHRGEELEDQAKDAPHQECIGSRRRRPRGAPRAGAAVEAAAEAAGGGEGACGTPRAE